MKFNLNTGEEVHFALSKKTELNNSVSFLTAEENQFLGRIKNEKTKNNFILGRIAAKKTLLSAGLNPLDYSLLKSNFGFPQWPPGFLGSISHCNQIAVAICSSTKNKQYLGIDIEDLNKDLNEKIAKRICTFTEQEFLLSNYNKEDFKLNIIKIFSAKETLYKALFPECRIYFGFKDAFIREINPGVLKAILLKNLSSKLKTGQEFEIKLDISGNYLLTYLII